jgi:hypothetical protein
MMTRRTRPELDDLRALVEKHWPRLHKLPPHA